MSKRPKPMPTQRSMCATCPWRDGSPYAYLAAELQESALTQASRICHSTGSNAINARTGKPPALCRGARDVQLKMFVALGFLDEPTDAAWSAKCAQLGIEQDQSKKRLKKS
jgi:hypothetical protein